MSIVEISLNVKNGLNVWSEGGHRCYCNDDELMMLFCKFFQPQVETVIAFRQLMKDWDAIIAFRDGSRVVMAHGKKA